jgi:sugar lactone lactonase YvrE
MRAVFLTCVSLVLSGCGNAKNAGDGNEPGAWGSGQEWRLVQEARIGSQVEEGPGAFANVVDVSLDPMGRVWVADAAQHQIRIFEANGRHVRSIGRRGGGPGEFGGISGMAWAPDGRLWVLDGGNARFAVYDTSGSLISTRPRTSVVTTTPWPGRLDGQGRLYDVAGTIAPGGSILPVIVRSDAAGIPRDTFHLPRFQEELFQITRGDARNRSVTQITVPFTGRQFWAVDPQGRVWVANTAEYRIQRHAFDGRIEVTIHHEEPRVPVSREERDRMVESYSEFARQGGEIDLSRIPDTHPALGGFLFDDTGRLWVMPVTARDHGRVLDVFDPNGGYLGRVILPAPYRSTPRAIRGNRMVVIIRGDDDVQSLAIMRIEKPIP